MKGAALRRYGTESEIAAELRISVDTLRDSGILKQIRSTKLGRWRVFLWADVDRVLFGVEGGVIPRTETKTGGASEDDSVPAPRWRLRG